jgi:hypothetical protein
MVNADTVRLKITDCKCSNNIGILQFFGEIIALLLSGDFPTSVISDISVGCK